MNQRMHDYIATRIVDDPRERQLAIAGSDWVGKIIRSGKTPHGFGVLSDRAVYFKGPGYLNRRGSIQKAELDHAVPLEAVTGVRLVRKSAVVVLTLALFFLILAPTALLLDALVHYGSKTVLSPMLDCAVCLLLADPVLGSTYRIFLLLEILFITADAEHIRRNEIRRKKALLQEDISWQDQPSFLENPPPIGLTVPVLLYLGGLSVSCPVLCNIALGDGFAYILLSMALTDAVSREHYLDETSFIRNVPRKRIAAIGAGFAAVFLFLLGFVLLFSLLAAGGRHYIDIRSIKPVYLPRQEETFVFMDNTIDPEILAKLEQSYGTGAPPSPLWDVLAAAITLLSCLVIGWLLIRSVRKRFLEFRDQTEGNDVAVSLTDEETEAQKIRPGRIGRRPLTERERIRQRYRALIRKRRSDTPASWETPSQIEEKAGLGGTEEGARIHLEYENARYGGVSGDGVSGDGSQ